MASPLPVQNTNIVAVLRDHLPSEYAAVLVRIDDLTAELGNLQSYASLLERLASTVSMDLSPIRDNPHVQPTEPPVL